MKAYPKALLCAAVLVLSALLPSRAMAAQVQTWLALQDAIDRAGDGEVIALSEDLTALETDAEITVPVGKCLVLDLNGHVLDRHLNALSGRAIPVITVEAGAMLTVRDSGGTGVITGGCCDDGGGVRNRGILIVEGGCITGNTALSRGGGVYNDGTMVLMGGTVTGNAALKKGGGVFNYATAHLAVNGDIVFGNRAPAYSDILNEGTLTAVGTASEGAHIEDMPVLRRYMTELSVIPTAVLLFALLLAVWLDAYLTSRRKRMMAAVITLVFSLMLQNYIDYRLSLIRGTDVLRTALAVYGYVVRPVILAMFFNIVRPGGRYRIAWGLVGANAAVYMTAFFSDIAIRYYGGQFHVGPLRHSCTVVSALLLGWLFGLTMRQFRPRQRKESWIPILAAALIAGSVAMDFMNLFNEQPVAWLTIAIAISCVFYYIWLHLQFVREHEDALRAGQRVQLMLSQIQPHFLFNTMEVIRRMCRNNPSDAEDAIIKLERYLRGNMDSMAREGMVPFDSELEHARLYLELEQMRFPGELHVVYDLSVMDFMLPSLTLQPLVENAVRHGVREKKSGEGTVTIATRAYADRYEVAIADDGEGFDPNAIGQDGQTRIGITNVRERLGYAGARLSVASQPQKGTVATIIVPRTKTEGNEHAGIRAGR